MSKLFMPSERRLHNEPTPRLSRRDLFRSAGKTAAGLLLLEKLGGRLAYAQEITRDDSLQSGIDKLKARVMTGNTEVAAALRINEKTGDISWDNFQQGTNYEVSQTNESVSRYLEDAGAKGHLIIYFHTHPISAIDR